MALSLAHAVGSTFQTGLFTGGAPPHFGKEWYGSPLPRPTCAKVGKLPRQPNLIQASNSLPWVFDEDVTFGGLPARGVRLSKPRKREVRVGAKWLHGLKGESKTGGTGSSGSTIFERLGEAGGPKSSTAATAVRDSEGNSENGRASLKVDDDFDEDAYAEEEEEDDEEVDEQLKAELEASLRATQREPENGVAKPTEEEAGQGDLSAADGAPKDSEKVAELRMGLDTMRKAVENYFGAVYTVARLMPTAERKEFLDSFKGDQMIDLENALGGDKETFVLGLDGEDRTTALSILEETLSRCRAWVTSESDKLDKDAGEYTLVNDEVVPKTPDAPAPTPSELQAFIGRTLQEASYKSQEAMLEATWRMGDLPRFPDLPLQPGVFDDVESEEELRQKIAEQKLLMYGQAEQMRQELEEKKDEYRRNQEAWAAERRSAEQNGRPSVWQDRLNRFGRDPEAERMLEEGERVIEAFEDQIEEEFADFERSLGLRPAGDRPAGQPLSEQDYRDIGVTIQKIREDLEEGLRADEGLPVPYLRKPLAESEVAEMEQTYRDMIENAEEMKARGDTILPGAFDVMESLSGAISRIDELIKTGRIEVVRDRDYLDALRAYEAARDGTEDDDYKPVADRMPSTPEEVLTAIEDGITSLDYTLSVLNDNERRPLTADEVIEMQVMDEGVVQWRDEILDLMTNQTQVKALAKLDSLIDRTRPFYMVGAPRPLKPFTGFKDPNAAAVANVWADLIGEKLPEAPVSTEEAVTSAWGSLFDDASSGGADSAPVATPPREESVNGAAMPGLNGIALGDGEPTGSAKMENVMTIGNGIQLDLGAAQADRLTAAPGGTSFRESDPP
ncbi:hypothetical protein KFL_000120570 [Klebsormidium nitens]|uniref:Uncharacterized protein n=1 Tax=Klebsormidium nitens TaxID=105231 RepID=A0A1Y1HN42_KLENI|nr:hypothetical protein KFL_000120570 [Klebsormidium nitens]|eukprot:GAQ78411.1 hypothetical protein KFL_000120570 [Klebsormidium nitens]